ncbi:ABC transporter ATP-binding protein [Thermodesulfobacteriota bacterium]
MDSRLKEYAKPYLIQYIIGFLLLILTNSFALGVPWILKYAIDDLILNITYEKLTIYSLLIVAATLLQGGFRFFSRQRILKVSHMIQFDILNDFFKCLLSLPLSFYNKNKTGDLISLATNDLKSVRMMAGIGILNIMNTLILVVCTITLLLMISVKLTLLALVPLPLIAIFVKRYSRLIHKHYKGVQEEFARINSKVHENVSGIRVVKAYTRSEDEVKLFDKLCRNYLEKNMKVVKLFGTIFPLVKMLSGCGVMMVLWIGGREVIAGNLTIGEFVAVNAYLAMLIWPMIALGWVMTLYQRGHVAMDRINAVMETIPEIVSPDEPVDTTISGNIKISDLTFRYADDLPPVLRNINIDVKSGERVAIVGPTGAGKTTLANLMVRMYKVDDSKIFFDGVDVNKIDLTDLRRSIGYVPQETFLFSDTIRGNLAFGVENVTEEELRQYSDISDLLMNIEEFPNRFDTSLGERGINLSGGQKQRASITRAIIKDPKVLILDDATSSVDVQTEENIINRLVDSLKDSTLVMVSHRIATVMDFDKIIVLNEGEIEASGTHDELIKSAAGTYHKMYERYLIYKDLNIE